MTVSTSRQIHPLGYVAALVIKTLYKPVSGFLTANKLKKRCAYHALHPSEGSCSGIIAEQFMTQGFSRAVMKGQFAQCHEAYIVLQQTAEQRRKKRKKKRFYDDDFELDFISLYCLSEALDDCDTDNCFDDCGD